MVQPIGKQRPILLTAFLGFMIAFNIIQISTGWTALDKEQFVHPDSTRFVVLVIQNIAYIICCIALIKWKRWGFWAICAVGVLALIANLFIVGDTGSFIQYAIEVGILYFLLKTGGAQNVWDQLE
jgi:bacteriorhodopsin